MATEVVIYEARQHKRSKEVCHAMLAGLQKLGERVRLRDASQYRRPEARVAVFYGLADGCRKIFREYKECGLTAVYVDLGYWKRKDGGNYLGYHKFSVNDRHPTAYFQKRAKTDERARMLGLSVAPWREQGKHILIAGMSPKGSRAEGFPPSVWERRAVQIMRQHTDRPIVYRPKPKWEHVPKIPGTMFRAGESLDAALRDCHAVVTHHSNVSVDGLLLGVPAFVVEGAALVMGSDDLRTIETPRRPDGREQWLADLAWCQWNIAEMREGAAWRYLKDEGLVP